MLLTALLAPALAASPLIEGGLGLPEVAHLSAGAFVHPRLSLEARYESSSVSCELPYPGYGNPAPLEQAAAMSQGDEVIVIVGESIDGDTYSTYGVSGNIPGTLIETTRVEQRPVVWLLKTDDGQKAFELGHGSVSWCVEGGG